MAMHMCTHTCVHACSMMHAHIYIIYIAARYNIIYYVYRSHACMHMHTLYRYMHACRTRVYIYYICACAKMRIYFYYYKIFMYIYMYACIYACVHVHICIFLHIIKLATHKLSYIYINLINPSELSCREIYYILISVVCVIIYKFQRSI